MSLLLSSKGSEAADEVDPQTLEMLTICRHEEARLQSLFKCSLFSTDVPKGGWYLVSSSWYHAWVSFIEGSLLRPKMINNAELLHPVSGEAFPGLLPNKDYVGVDSVGWGVLSEIYGADVMLSRLSAFNIYAED